MQTLIQKEREKERANRKHNKTIFETIFRAILSVLVIEVVLVLGTVFATGLTSKLKENAEKIFIKQTENRAVYVQNQLLEAQNLYSFQSVITEHITKYLESGALTIEQLNSTTDTVELLQDICVEMIDEMRAKTVNGMFLILNTQDLSNVKDGTSMPGIYIRDLDPEAVDSQRNEDISFEFAPSEVVQSMKIYTDTCWKPAFYYTKQNAAFMSKPFQAAYNAEETLTYDVYGYWTTKPFTLVGDTRTIITYAVPLMLEDGTVYGVAGIELQTEYLEEKFPYEELGYNETSGYVLAYTTSETVEEDYVARRIVEATANENWIQVGGVLNIKHNAGKDSMYIRGADYFVHAVSLNLYSRNAPFSGENWLFLSAVDKLQLQEMAIRIQNLFFMIAAVMLLLGLICCIIVSRVISRPIVQLQEKIHEFEKEGNDTIPELPGTGIEELDHFSASFTRLGRNILDSSTRFLKIIDMASIGLGGYEVRYKDNKAYVTNDYFELLEIENPYGENMSASKFSRIMMKFYTSAKIAYHTKDGGVVFEITKKDGSLRYIRLLTAIEGDSQIGIAEDVTTSAMERQRLQHDRDYDILTGLLNRKAFLTKVPELLKQPKRMKNAVMLTFDTDNLKKLNDTYGHDWGDRYICMAAKYISEKLPEQSVCAHVSGDEFSAFAYGYDTQEEIFELVKQFQTVDDRYALELPDGHTFRVSVSCGAACYPQDTIDFKTLQKYADFAMYEVKRSEKGHMKLFSRKTYEINQRNVQMTREFMQILKNYEEVSYYFQPIVSAQTGEIAAYEALMRVNKTVLKSPADVMRLAREKKKLYELERITILKSLMDFDKLYEANQVNPNAKLFINSIASVKLKQEDMEKCMPLLQKFKTCIVIEITEEERPDLSVLEAKREQLRGIASFAMDDYGSGYSNDINLLKIVPEYIKLDYGIVHDIHLNENKRQIMQNIIEYAHQHDMKVIAEGIESREELHCAIALGVDMLQGFFIARPEAVPSGISEEAEKEIKNKNL